MQSRIEIGGARSYVVYLRTVFFYNLNKSPFSYVYVHNMYMCHVPVLLIVFAHSLDQA